MVHGCIHIYTEAERLKLKCRKEAVTDIHKTHRKIELLLFLTFILGNYQDGCSDIHFTLHTSPYVRPRRQITAIVLLYHNVNKTCPLISSNIVIRGPGWRCYSTNICKAMHHLRLYESHNIQWLPPLPPANVNYHISPLTFISNG